MSHVTHMNESCHTYEWVMSCESCHVTQIMKQIQLSTTLPATRLIHTCSKTATRCNTLQHTATWLINTYNMTETHCNTLQHTATWLNYTCNMTDCNTLQQHTASCCNTLQHTATHCSTLQHTTAHHNTLPHTATHCRTLQHTVTHCNTLLHTATRIHQCLPSIKPPATWFIYMSIDAHRWSIL